MGCELTSHHSLGDGEEEYSYSPLLPPLGSGSKTKEDTGAASSAETRRSQCVIGGKVHEEFSIDGLEKAGEMRVKEQSW